MMFYRILLFSAALHLCLAGFSHASTHADHLTVLVSAYGDDSNDGLTLDTPIKTLQRAQEVIKGYIAVNGERNIEVRIGPGEYEGQNVVWDFTMPDHKITFMPLFGDKNRPVFSGRNSCGTWFTLKNTSAKRTNLSFQYIRVENYQTAMFFQRAHHNSLNGMYFMAIGNQACPQQEASTSGLRIDNSDYNQIENSHFVQVQNVDSCNMKSLYLTNGSDNNYIRGNRFTDSCSVPIGARNNSNNNLIEDNRFINVSEEHLFVEWYCQGSQCKHVECPSWNNQLINNFVDNNYNDEPLRLGNIASFAIDSSCPSYPAGTPRLVTEGN
ncbi:MAG: right-handed parallel beta-helix repeat-containing protein, partial [Ketobacteraceae bacterium]|nr:right-handed parallel beta-helix repeat-containing protein [Ketobacteraceae bacterium]